MPAFTRRTPSTNQIPPGCRPSPSTPTQYLLPTGVPSLDDLLSGGLSLGQTALILAPDTHSAWSRLISRYWIAQGLLLGQKSLVVGGDEGGRDLVRGCMWVNERDVGIGRVGGGGGGGSESEGEGVGGSGGGGGGDDGRTKIAWRYERMKKFQTTISSSSTGTRELDLTTTIPVELLDHLEKTGIQRYLPVRPSESAPSGSKGPSSWNLLSGVLERLKGVVEGHDDKSAMRITIHDLGSLDWGEPSVTEINRFLHCIRTLTCNKSITTLLTLPPHLSHPHPSFIHLTDTSLTLSGFASSPTLPPLYPNLHGLLTLHKLPSSHNILPPSYRYSTLLGLSTGAGENNLGFRGKRRRWGVETVHLGIEGGVGERSVEPPKGGMELVGGPPKVIEAKEGEGIEKVGGGLNAGAGAEGVDMPKGPKEGKVKKVRARVRFGGEEEFGGGIQPEVEVGKDGGHSHDHAGHGHGHGHGHQSGPTRPEVLHDRPDLYEF